MSSDTDVDTLELLDVPQPVLALILSNLSMHQLCVAACTNKRFMQAAHECMQDTELLAPAGNKTAQALVWLSSYQGPLNKLATLSVQGAATAAGDARAIA